MPTVVPFSFLAALRRSPWLRRAVRVALGLSGVVAVGCTLIFLLLRFLVLPHIADYRSDLEQRLSAAISLQVHIGRLDADWEGLRPRLRADGLQVLDPEGHPVLELDQVEAVVGWTSLLFLQPRLHRLVLEAPLLDVRRDKFGQLFVAGLPVSASTEDAGLGDWLLAQNQVLVRRARVSWLDEKRQAPPLVLSRVNLDLRHDFGRHRFGLTAEPSRELASRLDLRGDLQGRRLGQLQNWSGQLYAELEYADLAVWRTWLDYPLELPQGRGGVRFWLDLAQAKPQGLTADISLSEVRARLAPTLPMLELERLHGRISARQMSDGFELQTQGLTLHTHTGINLPATDLHLRWQEREGEFTVNDLSLGALDRLADYLPLPPPLRSALTAYGPRGQFKEVQLAWHGRQAAFEHFSIRGRVAGLALAAQGDVPGVEGISGSIEGSETGGRFELESRQGALLFPAIFVESRIPLEALSARGSWKASGRNTQIQLQKVSLRNQDAEGQVSGTYLHKPGQLGDIDLNARFSRAEGSAVWRYMPRVVSADVAGWLKAALRSGQASDTTLQLKGDLKQFPFARGEGTFRIQGNFRGGSLKYAPDWPQIDDIAGKLLFDGVQMRIEASQGRSLGALLGPVTAEIHDLSAPEELLVVTGRAGGPTLPFLKFIESSPVGGWIDHATADMNAAGNGELDLNLQLPLRQLATSTVTGGYRFDANRLWPDPSLPPLEDVRGRIEFTQAGLSGRGLRARILGGPATIDLLTDSEGRVAVDARGEVNGAQLRQQFAGRPLFDHLSGNTRWSGTVRVKGKGAELRLVSDLKGLASSLPEPFNKSATEDRSLVFERKLVPGDKSRDQIELSLAKALSVQLLRRLDDGPARVERGIVRVGEVPAPLPEQGTLLAIGLPRLDVDFWRFVTASGVAVGEGKSGDGLGLSHVDLRVNEFVAFGREIHGLSLTGQRQGGQWHADLKSREMAGRLTWKEGGAGRLSGRMTRFSLPAAIASEGESKFSGETLEELPALDLVADHFFYQDRDQGDIRISAENKGGDWNTTLALHNEDGTLSGQGRWRLGGGASQTRFDFKLKARSIEKLLNRIGYPDAVRRGNASLEGNLSWQGVPFAIDYPSLEGSLKVKAQDGQFNKLEPGAGRLLGILSLQSLPRRITLDFRDVFSEGFAFDVIEGQASVSRGVMETKDLEIRGPAARVAMQGQVDLARETQNLRVRVQPALGETLTTAGVLLSANPATGAAYWLANKLFGGPLDQVFAYEYAITGSWADPKVDKLGEPKPKEGQ